MWVIIPIKKKVLGMVHFSNKVSVARFSMLDCLLFRCNMYAQKHMFGYICFQVNKPLLSKAIYFFHVCSHFEWSKWLYGCTITKARHNFFELERKIEQLWMILKSFEKLSVQSPTYLVLTLIGWLVGCLSWGFMYSHNLELSQL